MSPFRLAIALGALVTPFSVGFADDQETQQLHNNAYQQVAAIECSSNVYCYAVFPVTTHVTTAITNVSCAIETGSGVSVGEALVLAQNSPAAFALQPFYLGYHTFRTHWGINGATNLFISKGQKPVVSIYLVGADTSTELSCTISGYHS